MQSSFIHLFFSTLATRCKTPCYKRAFWPNRISREGLLAYCQESEHGNHSHEKVMEMDRARALKRSQQHHRCSHRKEREKEEDSKNTWRRTAVGELTTPKHNCCTIRKVARSKQQWRTFIAVLHASGYKGSK